LRRHLAPFYSANVKISDNGIALTHVAPAADLNRRPQGSATSSAATASLQLDGLLRRTKCWWRMGSDGRHLDPVAVAMSAREGEAD
jgi:hypothetical protein